MTGDIEELFSPTEQAVVDPQPADLDDAALRDWFADVNRDWRDKADDEGPHRLLNAVAKQLAGADWSALLPSISPDFAVVAVSLERDGSLERNLRASVSSAVLERLRASAL
jgi:hypothetical protein